MEGTAEKARRLRLSRLGDMLATRLSHPPSALETLITELKDGHEQVDLWEGLHAAAIRDGQTDAVANSYTKTAVSRRLNQLSAAAHAQVLMHAADFHQGILGDLEGAEAYLLRVLDVVPTHQEAFERLRRRYQNSSNSVKLVELLAKIALTPIGSVEALAREAADLVTQLPARTPLPDEACIQLLAYSRVSLRVVDNLDAHCRKTNRAELASDLRERVIEQFELPEAALISQRRRLIELYLGEANHPEKSIDHVEELLRRDGRDPMARSAAEKLLSTRPVASRAAAILQFARQSTRSPAQ